MEGCPIVSVRLRDDVELKIQRFDRNSEIMSSRKDVTGLVFWSAAEVLAQLILSKATLFTGSSVAELGCGSGLAGVMCSKFAKHVLFTDANVDAINLAAGNAVLNQSNPEPRVVRDAGEAALGSLVMPSPSCDSVPTEASTCSISSAVLRWGVDDDAVVTAHGLFDFVVASEVLYVHWDDDTAMEDLARTMLCTAARLLRPVNDDSACGAGVCVFVYTPRYRGMGLAIRRACASLGLAIGSINRQSILSPEQAACGKFFSIRTVVVSPHEPAVRAFIGSLAPGGESDDEDWFNEEDVDPLASVCTDVFA